MSEAMQGEKAMSIFTCSRVLLLYFFILISAVVIDFSTDRSGGALMLAALPIAIVVFWVAISGQWRMSGLRTTEFGVWLIGCVLILAVTLYFVSLSADAAKVGTDIFTYAMFALAPPSSIFGTAAWLFTDLLPAHSAWLEICVIWLTCVICGTAQWAVLRSVFVKIRSIRTTPNSEGEK